MHDSPDDVLRFWFPPVAASDEAMIRQLEWWFRGGADATIVERYGPLFERAARGEHDDWAREPEARLALILVLDQFARSLHRGTARAYAQDEKACALALEGIDNGHYAALESPWKKTFCIVPLGHSEVLHFHDTGVALAETLVQDAAPAERRLLEHSLSQARGHRDVIRRFGRHPHRNAALGRESTPEEIDYLAKGEFVHTRNVPRG